MIDTALHFSGGKDSLACLYLFRDRWDDILVCWVNTGAAYPEVIEFMQGWKARLPHFLEIRSDQPAQIAESGFPSEVVPMNRTSLGLLTTKSPAGVKVQSHFACCFYNIWQPMAKAMHQHGIKRIIRGQRFSERRTSPVRNGQKDESGIEYVMPIQDWSDAEVFAYLAEVGAELPSYYGKERTSRDCWDCTAYLDESIDRIRHLAPEKRLEVERRLRLIDRSVSVEMAALRAVLGSR